MIEEKVEYASEPACRQAGQNNERLRGVKMLKTYLYYGK